MIRAGGQNILITNSLKNMSFQKYPDIIVLTGSRPQLGNNNELVNKELIMVQSGKLPEFLVRKIPPSCSIYYVRNSGAYTKRI
jgi:hypothetical protein